MIFIAQYLEAKCEIIKILIITYLRPLFYHKIRRIKEDILMQRKLFALHAYRGTFKKF